MTRSQHKHLAMVAALRVGSCRSISAKEKARKECLEHLRASLARHPVAAGESDINNMTQEA